MPSVGHHQGRAEQAGKRTAAKRESYAAERNLDLIRVGLELANAGIEVRDAASGRKVRESIVLKIGNLRAGVEEHPIVGAGNLGSENRDAHELGQTPRSGRYASTQLSKW